MEPDNMRYKRSRRKVFENTDTHHKITWPLYCFVKAFGGEGLYSWLKDTGKMLKLRVDNFPRFSKFMLDMSF